MHRMCFFCLLPLACLTLSGQDLSQIGKSEPVQVTGTAGMQYFDRTGRQSSTPYPASGSIWQVGLNVSLYGWNLPFSATYSNANLRWQQPFNRFSLQPSWKWIRVYLGDASMSFSPYSLNGHQFTGAGAELEPAGGKWKISIMGGRLLKQTPPDTLQGLPGSRQRTGYGVAGEYRAEKFSLGAGIFYASDRKSDVFHLPDSLTEPPAENLVLHSKGTTNLINNLQVQFEYALSFFTPIRRSIEAEKGTVFFPLKYYNGSACYNAFKTGFTYTSRYGSAGLYAERVDPGYRTLGAYYHLNDFANYTFHYAGSALQKKLSWSVASGWQHDNLAHRKNSTSRRLVHNLNLTCSPSESFQVNLSCSNFSRYMYLRTAGEYLSETDPWKTADTLHYRQVTATWGGTAFWQKEDRSGNRHQISMAFNSNTSREQSADSTASRGNFASASGGYTFSKPKNDLSCSIVLQYNSSHTETNSEAFMGPAFSLQKSLAGKKIQTYSTVSYNKTWYNSEKTGQVITGRAGLSSRLKNHTTDATAGMVFRQLNEQKKLNKEFTVNFSYRYIFSWKKNNRNGNSIR